MAARRLLPLMLDLNSKLVVIFGGGSVGERKARLFSDYARVRVVALDFTPALQDLKADVELISADLRSGFERYLEGAFIVIPATSDPDLNQSIEKEAAMRGIMVNRVDGAWYRAGSIHHQQRASYHSHLHRDSGPVQVPPPASGTGADRELSADGPVAETRFVRS